MGAQRTSSARSETRDGAWRNGLVDSRSPPTTSYEVKRGPPITMPAAVYPHTLAPGPSNVPLKGYGAAAVPPYQYNGLPRAGQPAATSSAPPKPGAQRAIDRVVLTFTGMRFTTSPFFRVEQQVSGVIECTGALSQPRPLELTVCRVHQRDGQALAGPQLCAQRRPRPEAVHEAVRLPSPAPRDLNHRIGRATNCDCSARRPCSTRPPARTSSRAPSSSRRRARSA